MIGARVQKPLASAAFDRDLLDRGARFQGSKTFLPTVNVGARVAFQRFLQYDRIEGLIIPRFLPKALGDQSQQHP